MADQILTLGHSSDLDDAFTFYALAKVTRAARQLRAFESKKNIRNNNSYLCL